MNRNSVVANSTSSSTINSTAYSVGLNPLIKLERLVYRLNSLLSIKFDESSDEFEIKKQLRLLLQVIPFL